MNNWSLSPDGTVGVPIGAAYGTYNAYTVVELPPFGYWWRGFSFHVPAPKRWTPHTGIGNVSDVSGTITATNGKFTAPQDQTTATPNPAVVIAQTGEDVTCTVSAATDLDKWVYGVESGVENDTVTYAWTLKDSGGIIVEEKSGSNSTSFKMPDAAGDYTVTVKIDDSYPDGQTPAVTGVTAPETGTKNDPAIIRSVAIKVIKLKLTVNGAEIGGAATPDLVVGAPVQLVATIEGLPSPLPLNIIKNDPKWNVAGEKIRNFVINTDYVADDPATPANEEKFPSGRKEDMEAADWNKESATTFYFTKGSFNGESASISYSISINGKTFSKQGTVKVLSPKLTAIVEPGTNLSLGPLQGKWSDLNPVWGIRGNPDPAVTGRFLILGHKSSLSNVGILILWAAEAPAGVNGQLALVQTVKTNRQVNYKDGKTWSVNSGGRPLLDKGYPWTTPVSISENQTTDIQFKSDSPGNPVEDTITTSFQDSFSTDCIFQPAGSSIWVKIGTLSWSISAASKEDGVDNYIVDPNFSTTPGGTSGTSLYGQSSYGVTEWEDNVQSLMERNRPQGH